MSFDISVPPSPIFRPTAEVLPASFSPNPASSDSRVSPDSGANHHPHPLFDHPAPRFTPLPDVEILPENGIHRPRFLPETVIYRQRNLPESSPTSGQKLASSPTSFFPSFPPSAQSNLKHSLLKIPLRSFTQQQQQQQQQQQHLQEQQPFPHGHQFPLNHFLANGTDLKIPSPPTSVKSTKP